MTSLTALYLAVADALDGPLPIESAARQALLAHAEKAVSVQPSPLPPTMLDILKSKDAHPCCNAIAATPLPWASPQTSDDPRFVELGQQMSLVELVGPDGLAKSNQIRMGLYGMAPNVDYGVRTHPAEELFVLLAGKSEWLCGDEPFREYVPGARRHHPSMAPHATRTRNSAFMSIYIWTGDISYDGYAYHGAETGAHS